MAILAAAPCKPDKEALARKSGFSSSQEHEEFLERQRKIRESADRRAVLDEMKESRARRGIFKRH